MDHKPRPVAWRIGLALLVGAACAVIPVLPAQADPPHPPVVNVPPTVGWSAEWHFETQTDPGFNDLGFSMRIPGVVLDGNGVDGATSRTVSISLVDSSPESGLCAYLTVTGNDDYYGWVACDGQIVVGFTDTTPSDYTFTLQLRDIGDTWHETSVLIVPSSSNYPALGNYGMRGEWEYISGDVVHYTLVKPGATVNGFASGWPNRTVDMGITASQCTTTTVYNPNSLGFKNACGGSGLVNFGVSALYGFKVVNCISGRGGRCVPLYVV